MPMRGELLLGRRSETSSCVARSNGLNIGQPEPFELELIFWFSVVGLLIGFYLLIQFPQYGDMFTGIASLA